MSSHGTVNPVFRGRLCLGWIAGMAGMVAGGVYAAGPKEVPTIVHDPLPNFPDVYILQDLDNLQGTPIPVIHVAYQAGSASSGSPSTVPFNTVHYQKFDEHWNPIGARVDVSDPDSERDAFEPRIVVNRSGKAYVTFVDFDRFDPMSTEPPEDPKAKYRVFDDNGMALTGVELVDPGSQAEFVPSEVTTIKGGHFKTVYATLADLQAASTSVPVGQYRMRTILKDGLPANGPVTMSIVDPLPFEPRLGLSPRRASAMDDMTVANVLVGQENFDGNFPGRSDLTYWQLNRHGEVLASGGLAGNIRFPTRISVGIDPDTSKAWTVWEQFQESISFREVRLNTIKPDGTLGREMSFRHQQTQSTVAEARNPDVAVNRDGQALLVYDAATLGTSNPDVFGQRFTRAGVRIAGPFRVNAHQDGNQRRPTVDSLPNGTFVVAFTTNSTMVTAGTGQPQVIATTGIPVARNVNYDTIVADDFGTPWTMLRDTGSMGGFNGGAMNSENYMAIAADPDAPESGNGVLEAVIGEGGGLLTLDSYDTPLVNPPSAEEEGLPFVVRATMQAYEALMSPQMGGVQPDIHFAILAAAFVTDLAAPAVNGEPFTVAEFSFSPPTAQGQWETLEAQVELDAQTLDMLVTGGTALDLQYRLSMQSEGASRLFFDELRVELIPPAAFVLGDMNGDGVFDAFDVAPFELALADPEAYMSLFPGIDPNQRGDFSGDGVLDAFDVSEFEVALAGGGGVVPEPSAILTLLAAGAWAMKRDRP